MANLILTKKQRIAWSYLHDDFTNELVFGGGAGGAKTFLGCSWLIEQAIKYPMTRWVLGRAVLKRLKETTLKTFFEVLKTWELEKDVAWHYNRSDGVVSFANGSEVLLKDLFTYPSDPNFDALGSLEITGAFVDEANEISIKAKNILCSRIRYKLDEYKLIPKALFTCNPAKNWVYSDFYKPCRDGMLLSYRQFVQALVTDNPFISKHYINNLKNLDKNSRERLLKGNWEYDDDPSKLFDIDVIADLFTNKAEQSDEKYISFDVARFGADKSVLTLWHGLKGKISWKKKLSTSESAAWLIKVAEEEGVRRSHIIIDEDGVGGGVLDQVKGAKGFLNGSKAIQPKAAEFDETLKLNYANLKTQCYFMLAKMAKLGQVQIECDEDCRELLTEDLEQIKEKDPDKDGRVMIIGKDQIKENIGRSCDYSDSIMMRFRYEVMPKTTVFFDSF